MHVPDEFETRPVLEDRHALLNGDTIHVGVYRHSTMPTRCEIRLTVLPATEVWEPDPAAQRAVIHVPIDLREVIADYAERVLARVLEAELTTLQELLTAALPPGQRQAAADIVLADARKRWQLTVKSAMEAEGL